MIAKERPMVPICVALLVATTGPLSAQLRTRTATTSPSITAVSPEEISLPPGGTIDFVVSGRSLDGAQELKFYMGTREAFDGALTGRIVGGDAYRVSLRVTASSSASPGATYQMKLLVGSTLVSIPSDISIEQAESGMTGILAPISPTLIIPSQNLQVDDLFGTPIQSVIARATTYFASCGGTSADRRYSVSVPDAGYSASGSVPRFEHQTTTSERLSFFEDHTLDPSDIITRELLDLPKSGHPSPVNHTVSRVRICLVPANAAGNWDFTRADATSTGAAVVIRASFNRFLFRARGMPMSPTMVEGIDVGIGWGSLITDAELPDFEWTSPVYEIRLPMEVVNGRITYGAPMMSDPRASSTGWSSRFLGPANLRATMVGYTQQRMMQIGAEIEKALAAPATRQAISSAIMSRLQSMHRITDVVSIAHHSGDMWTVAYR